jgi:homoserine dehydrogenase
MKTFNLGLLGYGNVGRALVRLLAEKERELREEFGVGWRVTGLATRGAGWLAAPEGFAFEELTSGAAARARELSPQGIEGWLAASRCDVMFETTPLEPLTGEPAVAHVRAALEYGAHVVTANKGPIVHAFRELSALARERNRRFLFEATVSDCLPVFSLFRESLPAAHLRGFAGVLNSTTTLILEEIAAGRTFDEGVRRAQEWGVAETDPTHDVDGWDAAVKLCAVANVLMDARLGPGAVRREGIRSLSDAEVQRAARDGEPYRLVARARRDADGVIAACVRPERLAPGGLFPAPEGTTMTIHFELDVLPGLTITAHRPDLRSTAYAMLADFINLARDERKVEG